MPQTRWPSMSKLSTQAKPMPLAAPVTTTCLREVANMNCLSIRIAGHTLVSTNVAAGLANTGGQLGLAASRGNGYTGLPSPSGVGCKIGRSRHFSDVQRRYHDVPFFIRSSIVFASELNSVR